MNDTKLLELSVVVLCYKAEDKVYDYVDKVVEALSGVGCSWNLILVGNYHNECEDKTPEIVNNIASENKYIKAVTLQKEGMMGWDARSGLSLADGKYICLIDGDDQMPSEDIARVYSKIKNSDLDLVQTYRVVRHDGVMRTIQSYFYNLIFKLMFPGSGVRDVNSKPKIFTKKVYDGMRLNSNDWFLDAEMIIHCARLKLKVAEIPTTFFKCKYRKSYVKFNAVFEFLLNLIMAKFSRRSQDA